MICALRNGNIKYFSFYLSFALDGHTITQSTAEIEENSTREINCWYIRLMDGIIVEASSCVALFFLKNCSGATNSRPVLYRRSLWIGTHSAISWSGTNYICASIQRVYLIKLKQIYANLVLLSSMYNSLILISLNFN